MTREQRSRALLLLGIPLGVLCGLLGLSGTEYRAPILRAFFRYPARELVRYNLTISVMTLAGAIVGREPSTNASELWLFLAELGALVAGSIVGVALAGRYASRIPEPTVHRGSLSILVVVGTALIGVTTLPVHMPGLPWGHEVRVPAGLALGVLIGAVSSVRGISGGELLIPALILAFGVDVKIAGTASACISFPIVLTGLVRRAREDTFEREREYKEIVVPMGVGSALGAVTGGYLLPRVSSAFLAILFGAVLIFSAIRSFQDRPES